MKTGIISSVFLTSLFPYFKNPIPHLDFVVKYIFFRDFRVFRGSIRSIRHVSHEVKISGSIFLIGCVISSSTMAHSLV